MTSSYLFQCKKILMTLEMQNMLLLSNRNLTALAWKVNKEVKYTELNLTCMGINWYHNEYTDSTDITYQLKKKHLMIAPFMLQVDISKLTKASVNSCHSDLTISTVTGKRLYMFLSNCANQQCTFPSTRN